MTHLLDPLALEPLIPAITAFFITFLSRFISFPTRGLRTTSFLLLIGTLYISLFYIGANYYTGHGVDESVYFHIISGLEGINLRLALPVIALSFTALIATLFSLKALEKIRPVAPFRSLSRSTHNFVGLAASVNLAIVFAFHPAVQQSKDIYAALFPADITPVSDHLTPPPSSLDFSQKNLIFIYLESVEATFLRENEFPGLMPNLNRVSSQSLTVRGIRQVPMTEWTIAGMTASQCGIPLASIFPKIDGKKRRDKAPLPASYCLGDWLSAHGVRLTYMGGADLNFASKGEFYRNHGFSEVMGGDDLETYLQRPLSRSKWGVYDDDLFDAIYKKLEEMQDPSQPFALFALTLDTHAPSGHETPICRKLGINHPSESLIEQRLACADYLIGIFFDWFKESKLYENTVLIIASDHFMMRNDTKVTDIPDRENLFIAHSKDISPRTLYREASTMDIAPTVMALLGESEITGFGLGRNLLKPSPTLMEQMGLEEFATQLQGWRPQLWGMWLADIK